MSFKEFWEKEKYVAIHAQTWKVRVVKYIVILSILGSVYARKGWAMVGIVFGLMLVLAMVMHFVFRWKTKAWAEPWGPFKPIPPGKQ